jgi:uncharacterized protein
MRVTLLDTGPWVAYANARDEHHAWAVSQLQALRAPLMTCEPVLAEICFLMRRAGEDPASVLRKLRDGVLKVDFDLGTEVGAVETLMRRYAETPMSLADACLVLLAERHTDCQVFTLDRDFRLYRRHGRQVIPLLSPW